MRRNPWQTLKRTAAEFREDGLTDWAAALTYYSLLSLFPALIAMVSLIGIFGDPRSTTASITEIIARIGPDSAAETFAGPVRSIASDHRAAGFAFVLGLAAALWSASGYVGAFMRASKTGPLVDAVAGPIGAGDAAVTAWNVAKWPAMAAIFISMVALLYYASPSAEPRRFRWVTPGSVVAIGAWALASAAFALYVANFGSYDKTYGTLAGVVILLIWLWITNLAILFGHQLNAELERRREMEEGVPGAREELRLEPRDAPGP